MAAKQAQHSVEYNAVVALCQEHNKNMFDRVLHPVRKEQGMIYSIIVDLMQTYGWMPSSIAEWLQFAR